MRVHLVLPPLTQLNTPYPSTAYLARALGERGVPTSQHDLGLQLVLRLFSAAGLTDLFSRLEGLDDDLPPSAWRALALQSAHVRCVDGVIRFLQG